MDIGGGSTEFILANASGVKDLVSLNIGISRIFQFFSFNDPMTDSDVEVVENYLEQNSEGFFNKASFQTEVQKLDTSKTYVIYCRSGGRSAKAASFMDSHGFSKVYNLEGGINNYSGTLKQ